MHRRNGQFWLMVSEPLTLEQINRDLGKMPVIAPPHSVRGACRSGQQHGRRGAGRGPMAKFSVTGLPGASATWLKPKMGQMPPPKRLRRLTARAMIDYNLQLGLGEKIASKADADFEDFFAFAECEHEIEDEDEDDEDEEAGPPEGEPANV